MAYEGAGTSSVAASSRGVVPFRAVYGRPKLRVKRVRTSTTAKSFLADLVADRLSGVSEPPLSMLDAFPELKPVTKHTDEKLEAMDAKIDRVLRHLNVEDSI
eukprot:COSAG06_NODE_13720_length_1225_cov_18.503552_1_plen_102_part_00